MEEIISKKDIVIVQFGSSSCPPCHDIKRKLEYWARGQEQAEFVYVSVDENPEFAAQNGVLSVPTVIVYARRHETIRESGYFSLDMVLSRVERYIEIMNEEEGKE